MSDRAETRRDNLHFRRYCQSKLAASHISAGVARTLALILDKIGSKTDYTYCYLSQRAIAATLSPNSQSAHKTIETHIQILKKAGLITVQALTQDEAHKLLAGYGQKLALGFRDRLNFYAINKQCPLWSENRIEAGRVADAVNDLLKRRFGAGNTRGRTGATPVDARQETPVDARAKHFLREDAAVTSSSPRKHTPSESQQTSETAPPSTLTRLSQKGVASIPADEKTSSCSDGGGFDLEGANESDSPQPAAVEGVAGSHPLHGSEEPDDSVTPQTPEHHLPENLIGSDDETVLEETASSATDMGFLESERGPTSSTPVPLVTATEEDGDGFLTGDGNVDCLLSLMDDE